LRHLARVESRMAVNRRRIGEGAPSPGPGGIVDIPNAASFNQGLSSANEETMLKIFGAPGRKTADCSPASDDFRKQLAAKVNVGPFSVSGLNVAVASLKGVFAEAEEQIPDVVAAVKNDGMLCVRHRRGIPAAFSNHAWGSAIDLFFGDAAAPEGARKAHRGCVQLAPFFNKHGWYWGAGFPGRLVNSMHFELAEETIKALTGAA
jgi:D-alanyl-D-alanine carboxypeptidase